MDMRHKIYKRHRQGNRSGVSLTEVVIATALLLVGLIPILRALTLSQASGRMIEHKSRSLTLAQARLDEIRAQCIDAFDDNYTQESRRVIGSYYDTIDDDRGDPLKTITVSVGYDDDENQRLGSDEVLITLSTAIAKRSYD
jgi:Tfp pilus assembly protein PilV